MTLNHKSDSMFIWSGKTFHQFDVENSDLSAVKRQREVK